MKYFRVNNDEIWKSDGSPVTIADRTINHMVIEEISHRFQDIVIGEEESSGEYGMGRRWICDPVDGTKAYVWGVPTAMFSLGFVIDGVPMVGVAYDPFLKNLYEAVRGRGSFCNGQPIRVSKQGINEGYIAMTSSPREIIKYSKRTNYFIEKGARLATFSGAVYKMCLVGQGFFMGHFEQGANAHDVAAGHVIVEEAGGKVPDSMASP